MKRRANIGIVVALALLAAAAAWPGDAAGDTRRCSAGDARICAGDVMDRETLKAFVEGAKDYLAGMTTLSEVARLRDLFRAEGAWRSGSLFLIKLLPNGTVLLHGADPTADSKDVSAVEDDSGTRVVQELLAAAARGGGFVEYDWDDPARNDDWNPKVAYAVGYDSNLSGNRLVVVGGWAQDLSQVPVEIEPLPRPAVTAADVVDRETLKAFVEAAAEAFGAALGSENYRALGNTKNAFRVDGGDWKSGSVYVFVISTEGYTLFHGAQPGRFEGRRFEDIDRRDVNGVRYIREVLAAGERGGGFVRYMFDNPAVEGDEETGSPKIAYATGVAVPGSGQVFVVGSGIYVTAERGSRAGKYFPAWDWRKGAWPAQ